LKRFSRGLSVLDTAITLAPLLGLLGTVTGLIRSFRLLGTQELTSPTAITGGIAEALIATACGLNIAIMALIPFNYLNARLEEARHDIEDSTTQLELLLRPRSLQKRSDNFCGYSFSTGKAPGAHRNPADRYHVFLAGDLCHGGAFND